MLGTSASLAQKALWSVTGDGSVMLHLKGVRMNKLSIALALLTLSTYLYAFKLDPYSKFNENEGSYEKKFVEPIHENFTVDAYNEAKEVTDISINLNDLILGVRWNDDPLQFFKAHPTDFLIYYKDSCGTKENIDASWDLLYRTHCGDMQFLHSMASRSNETAIETKSKIMMWAEFTFKVSTGEIPHNYRFENLNELLEVSSNKLFDELVTNHKTMRIEWQAEDLFTLECDRNFSIFRWIISLFTNKRPTQLSCKDFHNNHLPSSIQDRALGSLLHLVQDTFSDSHVERSPIHSEKVSILTNRSKIEKFLIYTEQDESKHSIADETYKNDESQTLEINIDLKKVSKDILLLSNSGRTAENSNWPVVKKILEKTFNLANPNTLPSGGKYQ